MGVLGSFDDLGGATRHRRTALPPDTCGTLTASVLTQPPDHRMPARNASPILLTART
jgi:hypothetical protein